MNKQEFNQIIGQVLATGIEITMAMDEETKIIWYNMNTRMKSDLEIAYVGEKCIFKGRYNHTGIIDSYQELLDEVSNCQYGRDFGDEKWFKVIENRYEPV